MMRVSAALHELVRLFLESFCIYIRLSGITNWVSFHMHLSHLRYELEPALMLNHSAMMSVSVALHELVISFLSLFSYICLCGVRHELEPIPMLSQSAMISASAAPHELVHIFFETLCV